MSSKGKLRKASRPSSVAPVKRQPSFRAVRRSSYSYLTSGNGGRNSVTSASSGGWARQLEAAYSNNDRLMLGYFSRTASTASQNEGTYCCEDCSSTEVEPETENYVYNGPNKPWPIVSSGPASRVTSAASGRSSISAKPKTRAKVKRQGSKVYQPRAASSRSKTASTSASGAGSSVRRTVTRTITTTTKTLVSLKSLKSTCRSLSEVETLPPSGYLVKKATYVNENYASDDENEGYCRDTCCRQR